jgi:stage V sporulation protein AD
MIARRRDRPLKDKKRGRQTVQFSTPPCIVETYTIAGPLEGQGPLGELFDRVASDSTYGQRSFEKAESKMMEDAVNEVLRKTADFPEHIDFLIASDLLDQIIISSYTASQFPIPFLGMYSACSATALCSSVAAILIDGGYASRVVVATSSHNSAAERQYRYPVEYGMQRPPYSQSTATGAAAALIAGSGDGPKITSCTFGRVIETGVNDPFNMGAAMAPAALDTIIQHFEDISRGPDYYDLIVTGDLGEFGHQLLKDLAKEQMNMELTVNLADCGIMLYDKDQGVDAGGSGCVCSALVLFSKLYRQLRQGSVSRLLLVATGALHSPTSCHQGEAIPSIAHAMSIER